MQEFLKGDMVVFRTRKTSVEGDVALGVCICNVSRDDSRWQVLKLTPNKRKRQTPDDKSAYGPENLTILWRDDVVSNITKFSVYTEGLWLLPRMPLLQLCCDIQNFLIELDSSAGFLSSHQSRPEQNVDNDTMTLLLHHTSGARREVWITDCFTFLSKSISIVSHVHRS